MKIVFTTLIFGLSLFYICNGCLNNNLKPVDQSNLKSRIDIYYDLLKNEKYTDCYNFWDTNVLRNQDDFVSYAKKSTFDIVSYSIKNLIVSDKEAKAIMNISIFENGKIYETTTSDQWKIIKGQWCIVDFGRGVGDETVQEFNYPEDYDKLNKK